MYQWLITPPVLSFFIIIIVLPTKTIRSGLSPPSPPSPLDPRQIKRLCRQSTWAIFPLAKLIARFSARNWANLSISAWNSARYVIRRFFFFPCPLPFRTKVPVLQKLPPLGVRCTYLIGPISRSFFKSHYFHKRVSRYIPSNVNRRICDVNNVSPFK